MVGCQSEDPTPIIPTGDPVVAAHDFVKALFSGNVESCRQLSTESVRDSIEQQCIQNANIEASIDLTEVTFSKVSQERLFSTVSMTGQWTLSAVTEEGEVATETHRGTLTILMLYEDGKWRFFDWGADNSQKLPLDEE